MDMIGRKDDKRTGRTNYLYSIGTDLFPEIGKSLEEADQTYKSCSFDYSLNNSKDISGVYYRSDQYSFYQKNIPSIFFFSGLHSDYHKQTDTAKKIDYTRLQNRVRLIGEVINLIQNERSE